MEFMSELIQSKKELTFEEICPYHSSILGQWDKLSIEDKQLEIFKIRHDPSKCFVGEAHGGDSSWDGCRVCSDYGFAMTGGLPIHFDLFGIDWEGFEKNKQGFVKHWNECHVKLP